MNSVELKENLEHNRHISREYTKHLRILEAQAAKFGLHVPAYIQLEINEITDKINILNESSDSLRQKLVSQLKTERVYYGRCYVILTEAEPNPKEFPLRNVQDWVFYYKHFVKNANSNVSPAEIAFMFFHFPSILSRIQRPLPDRDLGREMIDEYGKVSQELELLEVPD